MRDLYSDDYGSVAGPDADRLVPEGVRRLTGAAIFVGLIAGMGLWSYRLGTRDAGDGAGHPRDRGADAGRARRARRPAGGAPGPRGQRGARRASGAGARDAGAGGPGAEALADEDAPQGELVLKRSGGPRRAGARPRTATCRCRRPRSAGRPSSPPLGPTRTRRSSATGPVLGDDGSVPAAGRRGPRPRNRPRTPRRRPRQAEDDPVAAPTAVARSTAAASRRLRARQRRRREASGVKRARGSSSSGRSTARRSPARRWSQLVARNGDLLGSKSLYVERTTANARVFYRLRVAGFVDVGRDPADVRGVARARRRLHPGDAAVDGAPAPSSSAAAGPS